MEPVRMADVPGTIATFTVDVVGAQPARGGGDHRLRTAAVGSELTDVDPAEVAIGDRVEMTFAACTTSGGIHNYFWKAKPMSTKHQEA